MSAHTGPELATERRICGRIRARILRNPCGHCIHRVEGWGAAACTLADRRYPMCLTDGRALQFDLDTTTIEGATND